MKGIKLGGHLSYYGSLTKHCVLHFLDINTLFFQSKGFHRLMEEEEVVLITRESILFFTNYLWMHLWSRLLDWHITKEQFNTCYTPNIRNFTYSQNKTSNDLSISPTNVGYKSRSLAKEYGINCWDRWEQH